MCKVSIIIPVYNTEEYLEECLDSLLNQSLSDIQLIVVDDGSTDHSAKIIDTYAANDDRITVLHKKNAGQASARNIGLSLCKGDYIGFLDSDDYVRFDMFEKMYSKAVAEELDYVGCGYEDFMIQDGKRTVLSPYTGHESCCSPEDMFRGVLVSPFISMYKRTVLQESGAYFPEGRIFEDTAFLPMVIPFIKNPGFIQEALAYRRRRKNSTLSATHRISDIFKVLDILIQEYENKGMMEHWKKYLELFCVRILLCSHVRRISQLSKRKDRKKMTKKTWTYINDRFPEFRKNHLLRRNRKEFYIKHSTELVIFLICEFLHYRGRERYQ